MTDPNDQNNQRQDANIGPSQDNFMDIDPEDMVIVDDDDEDAAIFQADIPLAPAPMMAIGAGGGRGVPPRVRSSQSGGVQFPPQFLFRGTGGEESPLARFDWNLRVMAARHLENRGHTDLESGGKGKTKYEVNLLVLN